jgi:hypothetical protein
MIFLNLIGDLIFLKTHNYVHLECKEYENATQKTSYFMSLPGFPKRKIVTDKCQHKSVALIVGK